MDVNHGWHPWTTPTDIQGRLPWMTDSDKRPIRPCIASMGNVHGCHPESIKLRVDAGALDHAVNRPANCVGSSWLSPLAPSPRLHDAHTVSASATRAWVGGPANHHHRPNPGVLQPADPVCAHQPPRVNDTHAASDSQTRARAGGPSHPPPPPRPRPAMLLL